jgi:hypothetical protein
MKRIWFIAVPLALLALTWIYLDFEMAIAIALISFISATIAYLIAVRLNFRWANLCAVVMAFGGLVIYGYVEHRILAAAHEIDPSDDPFATATCPPDGCRMIAIEPELDPEPEIYP